MTLVTVLGDDNTGYATSTENLARHTGFAVTATATTTLTALALYNTGGGGIPTHLYLSLNADDAGGSQPGTFLGGGIYSPGGVLPSGNTLVVDGLSIPITNGTRYWICTAANGTVTVAHGPVPGGTDNNVCHGDYPNTDSLANPWASTDYSEHAGPIGIWGMAPAPEVEESTIFPAGLVFQITGLWKPGETSVTQYGQVVSPLAGDVTRLLDDSCTASVTFSMHDPIAEALAALDQVTYATCLRVYYDGACHFWGPVKVRDRNFTEGTVRLDAVDPTLRLARHFLRRGDTTGGSVDLGSSNHDQGYMTVDHIGIRLLRDAGNINEAVFPPLGIIDGSNDYIDDPDSKVGVQRGDPLLDKIVELSQTLGPDFSVDPDDTNTPGVYATLNTYTKQGVDRTATVQLHYQLGKENLEGLEEIEGEEYANMVHVLDSQSKYRVTVGNATTLVKTGPYIEWEQTELDTTHLSASGAQDVLTARGIDIMKARSRPSSAVTVQLRADSVGSYRYGVDFSMGDTISVAGQEGFETLAEGPHRIVRWSASVDGENVRQALDVIADRTSGDSEAISVLDLSYPDTG